MIIFEVAAKTDSVWSKSWVCIPTFTSGTVQHTWWHHLCGFRVLCLPQVRPVVESVQGKLLVAVTVLVGYKFLIATTSIVNGSKLVSSVSEAVSWHYGLHCYYDSCPVSYCCCDVTYWLARWSHRTPTAGRTGHTGSRGDKWMQIEYILVILESTQCSSFCHGWKNVIQISLIWFEK